MKDKYLVVGAGISGCTIAERLACDLHSEVVLIDERSEIGGNCHDFTHESGIIIQQYGPHIFHTNDKNVWDYLSRFTNWEIYFHRVLAIIEGMELPVPFNLNSIYKAFPPAFAERLENLLIAKFGYGTKIPILKLMKEAEPELKILSDYIYNFVFLGYTAKQWGTTPEDIDPSVCERIPVYISRDDRYFQDRYQGIPREGFSEMMKKMVNRLGITIKTNCKFEDFTDRSEYKKIFYTGKIDRYFNYCYGYLPYRSLKFKYEYYKREFFQKVAQVNYPNNYDFTRITEFKHFLKPDFLSTIIAKEYPLEHIPEENDAFYPVVNGESSKMLAEYKRAKEKETGTIFLGRLAEFKYYNMDAAVKSALEKYDSFKNNRL